MVTKVVKFHFKNALNHKIDEITVEMLEAVTAAQNNQSFFHEMVNRASHLFQHRQLVGKTIWQDLIKVYVGMRVNEIMLMRIDETDELPENVIAVPLGLLMQLAEISDVSIPVALPLDASTAFDDDTSRGLMYNWVHTDTEELAKTSLEVWNNLITRSYHSNISEDLLEKIVSDPEEHIAILCETIAINLTKKDDEKKKNVLFLTALHMTNVFAENIDDVSEILLVDDDERSVEDISEIYQAFDLISLYNWIGSEIGFVGIFDGFQGFIAYCRLMLNNQDFMITHPEKWAWLHAIIYNTDTEDFQSE